MMRWNGRLGKKTFYLKMTFPVAKIEKVLEKLGP